MGIRLPFVRHLTNFFPALPVADLGIAVTTNRKG
jgi:hypothetical protein